MPISWNEIRHNVIRFARQWSEERREDAEAKTFWDEFFAAFGIRRRTVASFEQPVHSLAGTYGYIDLFWPGMMLVEHKSRGQSLDKAASQAFRYIQDLASAGRNAELPRYVILSDFARVVLYDLEPEDEIHRDRTDPSRHRQVEFPLTEFHEHIHEFAFIPGYKQHRFTDQDPINIEAVEILGNLHDTLEAGGYCGHALERFLVRVLFCLFAEDTGLFEREVFRLYLENRTAEDGSDLGAHLARLFEVLNTPQDRRQRNLEETLAAFPYVNGDLFAESLGFADLNRDMRNALLACTRFDWSRISPAVFGSLFQAIMEPKARRQMGGHYTSERDILKVVHSLFLDDLRAEFERVRHSKPQLQRFHEKLGTLRFLDPACGCGNFLVVTYRELRLLEIEVLKALHGDQMELDIHQFSVVDVDAFYGIEILEWPARIAEVAMWLMDHQMNLRLSETFGQYFLRLPLRKSAHILHANALRLDWSDLLPASECSFVLGNPPFVGKKARNENQQEDMALVFANWPGAGVLDYVCCWYALAVRYIQHTSIVTGFVSTNSITQGEQVGVFWPELWARHDVSIRFAHRTFPWESEARGKAHVHVVIIGFAATPANGKRIYDYSGARNGDVAITEARQINPYLVDAPNIVLRNRETPLCDVPPMQFGNMPNDDGCLLLTAEDRKIILRECPQCRPFLRPFISAKEYLHGLDRWCLWLEDAVPEDIKDCPAIDERVKAVRKFRAKSCREATRKLAKSPALFGEIRQPASRFVLVPRHSSENREYIPLSFFTPRHIVADSCLFVEHATLYHFGVLSSAMHMVWVRHVCGRLESRYRYSAKLVYNNYPWPENPTKKARAAVEVAAKAVLDARACYPSSALANLYDPNYMPATLVKAHVLLNRSVEQCYRSQTFASDLDRISFLFAEHARCASPLFPAGQPRRKPPRSIAVQNTDRTSSEPKKPSLQNTGS